MAKKPANAETVVKVKDVSESIYVLLIDEERAERAKLAAKLQGDLARLRDELKLDNEFAKKEIKKTDGDMTKAAKAHNDGREFRHVKCERIFDLKTNETWLVYNGKEYARRRMEQDEISNCQKDLFGKRPVEEKHARTAEDVAKDAATLPPELARASTKKSKLKAVETKDDGEDVRKETGYQ